MAAAHRRLAGGEETPAYRQALSRRRRWRRRATAAVTARRLARVQLSLSPSRKTTWRPGGTGPTTARCRYSLVSDPFRERTAYPSQPPRSRRKDQTETDRRG